MSIHVTENINYGDSRLFLRLGRTCSGHPRLSGRLFKAEGGFARRIPPIAHLEPVDYGFG